MSLKLYMHPVSTASRPVRLFIAEKKLPVIEQAVDLMTGEHHQAAYAAINPNKAVRALSSMAPLRRGAPCRCRYARQQIR
jgi:glutathione S-transferase